MSNPDDENVVALPPNPLAGYEHFEVRSPDGSEVVEVPDATLTFWQTTISTEDDVPEPTDEDEMYARGIAYYVNSLLWEIRTEKGIPSAAERIMRDCPTFQLRAYFDIGEVPYQLVIFRAKLADDQDFLTGLVFGDTLGDEERGFYSVMPLHVEVSDE